MNKQRLYRHPQSTIASASAPAPKVNRVKIKINWVAGVAEAIEAWPDQIEAAAKRLNRPITSGIGFATPRLGETPYG